jgi:hypothetical protein
MAPVARRGSPDQRFGADDEKTKVIITLTQHASPIGRLVSGQHAVRRYTRKEWRAMLKRVIGGWSIMELSTDAEGNIIWHPVAAFHLAPQTE